MPFCLFEWDTVLLLRQQALQEWASVQDPECSSAACLDAAPVSCSPGRVGLTRPPPGLGG